MINIHLNIKKVERTLANELLSMVPIPGYRAFTPTDIVWTEIPMIKTAEMQIQDQIENKQRIFTTNLKLLTTELLNIEQYNLVFRVTTVDGKSFIIGSSQSPYPTVTNSMDFPKEYTGRSGNTVTITYTALNPPLLLTV